jgi:hypothetical protein
MAYLLIGALALLTGVLWLRVKSLTDTVNRVAVQQALQETRPRRSERPKTLSDEDRRIIAALRAQRSRTE